MSSNSISIKKAITSVNVTKLLLREIEGYLFEKVPLEFPILAEHLKEAYKVEIVQEEITTTFSSINEYAGEIFPDDTEEISTGFSIRKSQFNERPVSLEISINFSESMWRLTSGVELETSDRSYREKLDGISVGLLNIFSRYKNINKIFHSENVKGVMFILLTLLGLGCANFILKKQYSPAFWFGFFAVIFGFYVNLSKFKPYYSFESNKQKRNDFIVKVIWSVCILGFLISFAASIVSTL
jgi:hypothetical protein